MEDLPYWIINDTIIFKPEFNEPIDGFIQVISKYNKLIFSNYDDPYITMETNNTHCENYTSNFKKSKFNKRIDNIYETDIRTNAEYPLKKFLCSLKKSINGLINYNEHTQSYDCCFSKLTSLQSLTFDGHVQDKEMKKSVSGSANIHYCFSVYLSNGSCYSCGLGIPSSN